MRMKKWVRILTNQRPYLKIRGFGFVDWLIPFIFSASYALSFCFCHSHGTPYILNIHFVAFFYRKSLGESMLFKHYWYYLILEFLDNPRSSVFDKKTKGKHFRETPFVHFSPPTTASGGSSQIYLYFWLYSICY